MDPKERAGRKAAELIRDGNVVGLGTGSTAYYFIQALCEKKLSIQVVASSRSSAELAKKGGLHLVDINSVGIVDITVDGADEIDPRKRMIKGGGGAHVREKILAAASREMVVIVDESKLVKKLGTKAKLPVEVLLYGSEATRAKIENLGFSGKWRLNPDSTLYVTENGNLLFDIEYKTPPRSPKKDHDLLCALPGVVDTGYFFHLAGRVIVGYQNGEVKILS
jgi:ribose 5-phosphate isomerase A